MGAFLAKKPSIVAVLAKNAQTIRAGIVPVRVVKMTVQGLILTAHAIARSLCLRACVYDSVFAKSVYIQEQGLGLIPPVE
jgi:hypothetical protein